MSKAGRALSPADRIDFGCLIFAALSRGVAVCKLDAERRQTPARNLNDESEVRAAGADSQAKTVESKRPPFDVM
jgi:hypothetical protein